MSNAPAVNRLKIQILLAGISTLLIGCAFIVPTMLRYEQTPSDPQKGIGYIIITIYGLVTGSFGGMAVLFFSQAWKNRDKIIWSLCGTVFAAIAILLFISRFRVA
ncbi:MAG: hypothetical protein LBK76_08880 [Verrucomicrobiales bacterium]|jgi:uncharacterized BrkB/YihY/UPF0761 family membrane protein|nr:hypothetical protein [Verrucomicrobiales bacterium]